MAFVRPAPDTLRTMPMRRLAAVAVLAVIAALYVGPVQKYLRVERDLAHQRASLAETQRRHDQLLAQRDALNTKQMIVTLARQCGWIFPGERPLVIEGIPASDGASCG